VLVDLFGKNAYESVVGHNWYDLGSPWSSRNAGSIHVCARLPRRGWQGLRDAAVRPANSQGANRGAWFRLARYPTIARGPPTSPLVPPGAPRCGEDVGVCGRRGGSLQAEKQLTMFLE
jgi:hypothetical protein